MKKLLVTTLIVLSIFCDVQGAIREISYYCPMKITQAPVIDGKLDDACWTNAPTATLSYEYFKVNPGPSELKTSWQMVYDHAGIYLAIKNFEKYPAKIRKNVVARDDPALWKDDCAEIYIDAHEHGAGFHKFVINAAGVVGDMIRVDGSVTLNDWNGAAWRVKTLVYPDCWTIEAFFPWDDLGGRANPGAIWRFCHVRYAWSSGKFQGSTSSPGGNYESIDNFGFLLFGDEHSEFEPQKLSALFSKLVPPPWGVALGSQVLMNPGNGVQLVPLEELLAEVRQHGEKVLLELKRYSGLSKAESDKLIARYQQLTQSPALNFLIYRQWHQWIDAAQRLIWKEKIQQKFN